MGNGSSIELLSAQPTCLLACLQNREQTFIKCGLVRTNCKDIQLGIEAFKYFTTIT